MKTMRAMACIDEARGPSRLLECLKATDRPCVGTARDNTMSGLVHLSDLTAPTNQLEV